MNIKEWRERIESDGDHLLVGARPARGKVDLRSERVTVRLSLEEVEAMEKVCARNGIGRSTFIRMTLRRALGLNADQQAAASSSESSDLIVGSRANLGGR